MKRIPLIRNIHASVGEQSVKSRQGYSQQSQSCDGNKLYWYMYIYKLGASRAAGLQTIEEKAIELRSRYQEGKMMTGLSTLCVFLAFGAQRVVGDVTSLREKLIPGKLGGDVNLTCDVITDYHNAKLSFNNTIIVERPGKFQRLSNGVFVLKNIQPSDTGEYKYENRGLGIRDTCIMKLEITEETMKVKPGSTILMSCKVPATMKMWSEVSWKRKYSSETATIVKNGSVTEFAKQNFSGRISASGWKLVIRNADQDDSGKYTCIVMFKDNLTRGRYYINLIVSMSSNIKPTTANEVKTSDESGTSTPFPAPSTTKSATKRKGCATRLKSYFPVVVLVTITCLESFY